MFPASLLALCLALAPDPGPDLAGARAGGRGQELAGAPAPGLVFDGDRARVTARSEGRTAEEARANAHARALAEAQSYRGTEVRSRVSLRQRETGGGDSEQDLSLELTTTARGRLVGGRVVDERVEARATDRHLATLTLELPREVLDPAWRIAAILDGPLEPDGSATAEARRRRVLDDFRDGARQRGDLEAVELACRMALRRRPEAELLLELCLLLEEVGRSAEALGTLERWRPRLGVELSETARSRFEKLERRLRGLAVDGEAQVERLLRLVRGADRGQLDLEHDLGVSAVARLEDVVRIRGAVPLDHGLYTITLDTAYLQTPAGRQWRIPAEDLADRPVVHGSPLARFQARISYAASPPGRYLADSFHPGPVCLVFLARAPDSPPPPLLEQDLELALCGGPRPDEARLARLSAFVDAMALWLQRPGNQALAVSWTQVE